MSKVKKYTIKIEPETYELKSFIINKMIINDDRISSAKRENMLYEKILSRIKFKTDRKIK